mmetsp:Transcript_1159/g.720  ORF Transcript_1159/g.720 Transcript_1159/m.720 type:complete len:86 (-) Transcript_1159:832-1089(-)
MKHANEPIFAQANWAFKETLKSARLLKNDGEIEQVVPKNRLGLITSMMFYHFDHIDKVSKYDKPEDVAHSVSFGLPTLLSHEYDI